MAQARPSDYPNIFVGFEYTIPGFFCGGGTLGNFFFHFFAENNHAMPVYLDRVSFVLWQLILSGSEIQKFSIRFMAFILLSIDHPRRLKSGIEVVRVNPAKKSPQIDIQDQRILKIKILSINGMCAKTQ